MEEAQIGVSNLGWEHQDKEDELRRPFGTNTGMGMAWVLWFGAQADQPG
jgi:hypothetical protein